MFFVFRFEQVKCWAKSDIHRNLVLRLYTSVGSAVLCYVYTPIWLVEHFVCVLSQLKKRKKAGCKLVVGSSPHNFIFISRGSIFETLNKDCVSS